MQLCCALHAQETDCFSEGYTAKLCQGHFDASKDPYQPSGLKPYILISAAWFTYTAAPCHNIVAKQMPVAKYAPSMFGCAAMV